MKCKYYTICGNLENCARCPESLNVLIRYKTSIEKAIERKRNYLKTKNIYITGDGMENLSTATKTELKKIRYHLCTLDGFDIGLNFYSRSAAEKMQALQWNKYQTALQIITKKTNK